MATRWYRPPELLVGEAYGSALDLWAAGCIMGELVAGEPLFPGEDEFDQLFRIQKCLGSLPPALQQSLQSNPRLSALKFP